MKLVLIGLINSRTVSSIIFSLTTKPHHQTSPLNLRQVCREFQRGKCIREADECRYAHPPSHVAIENGHVTACFDSLKVRNFTIYVALRSFT